MKQLVRSIVASATLLFGLAVGTQPAGAAFNCGGVSVIFNTRHIGGGQWIAEWQCGSGSPGASIPSGVTIDRVQLRYWSGVPFCTAYPSSGYSECHSYVAGGTLIRASAHGTNGVTYFSATKTT